MSVIRYKNIYLKEIFIGTVGVDGSTTDIAHGIEPSKVLYANFSVESDTGSKFPPNFTDTSGLEYQAYISEEILKIRLIAGNSGVIDGNAFIAVVTYKK